ncbi:predicted protein [Coccidioides posadasii str. Silveira]|uniref:Predicted protein n=1 Tax=Coccidioides posadasii (strain RMSCC 757 / Silveira) TaxID=443226 RepID=E9CTF7_COCPS|nr:predicted protein [Coccidioides posadasii str. Silveira]
MTEEDRPTWILPGNECDNSSWRELNHSTLFARCAPLLFTHMSILKPFVQHNFTPLSTRRGKITDSDYRGNYWEIQGHADITAKTDLNGLPRELYSRCLANGMVATPPSTGVARWCSPVPASWALFRTFPNLSAAGWKAPCERPIGSLSAPQHGGTHRRLAGSPGAIQHPGFGLSHGPFRQASCVSAKRYWNYE